VNAPADILPTICSKPGATGARYERTGLLAEGGLGRLYVARDTVLNRCVALKEIKPAHLDNDEARRRFLLEAQVTGQLEHPNIVPIHDLAIRPEDGTPYYTMRLVAGRTLREAISEYHRRRNQGSTDRLEQTRLLTAFIEICQAIAYAHSRGVVHRDLKPENVLLGNFGEVVVLDWGLAKVVRGMSADSGLSPVAPTPELNSAETLAGAVMGTPAYMAPEQAAGQVDQIDARTDIYGLGAILYEILTGRKPHEGATVPEVLGKAAAALAPSARLVEPSTPSTLDAICGRAMAREQDERYASAAEMAQEVQRYLADEPVLACPESWTRRLARWMRRNRSWTLAVAATLVVVAVVMAVAAVRLAQMAHSERTARREAERFRTQNLRTAATFASRTLAAEIDVRWRILEAEADNSQLRKWLLALQAGKALDPDQLKPIQDWLKDRFDQQSAAVKATSWFLLDREGTLVALSPFKEKVVGQNFASRDFFNGQGIDLPAGWRGPPLTDVHRSRVFKSKADHQLKVAFCVPIRASAAKRGEVLGVLAMSVELGRFDSLRLGLGAGQVVVLADTLGDHVESNGEKGLILHHPYLTKASHAQTADSTQETPIFRLDPIQVAKLDKLRKERLQQERKLESHPEERAPADDNSAVADNLDPNYHDPIDGDYAGRWTAAFEPVLVHGRAGGVMDTGLVVIVQERQAR
jgi:serine/threonine-protein kinase